MPSEEQEALTRARDEAERSAILLGASISDGLENDAPPEMVAAAVAHFEKVERAVLALTDDGVAIRVLASIGDAIRIAARTRDPGDIRRLRQIIAAYGGGPA